MNIDWNAVWAGLIPQLFTLLGLTLAQVILGIAVALKNKIFEWQKVADFYSTIIIPRVLAWLVSMLLLLLVAKPYLSVELSNGIQTIAFLLVVGSFTGSIIANFRALGVLPDSTTLDKIGLPAAISTVDISVPLKKVEKL